MIWQSYFLAAAVIVTALAAVFDWRTKEIPNWLSMGPLVVAPVAHFVAQAVEGHSDAALQALGFSIGGALICGAVPVALYFASAIGGGDLKLFLSLGAILRPMLGIEAVFYGFIVAALYAPAQLAYEGKLFKVLGNSLKIFTNRFRPKDQRVDIPKEMLTEMRFGPSIFVGTALVAILQWGPAGSE